MTKPDTDKLVDIAAVLNTTVNTLTSESGGGEDWTVVDTFFSPERMYSRLAVTAEIKGLRDTFFALRFMKKEHEGQFRYFLRFCIKRKKLYCFLEGSMKKRFSSELAYILGIVFVALGVVLMEKADFGVSMVVAPAYILYRWLSPTWGFFTFGMAEYCLQAVLLIIMSVLLRRFRLSYLFSFVTAVIYGFVLDGFMLLGAVLPVNALWQRIIYYVLGMMICSAGVSAMFHTYISPEVYELFVKEVSSHFHININKFKTGYDCTSCFIGIVMSFLVFGLWHFEGVKWGTILCALINGWIIGRFSAFYEKHWTFYDCFQWRNYFSN